MRRNALRIAAVALAMAALTSPGFAGEVTGKVVAVFHEKVQLQPSKQWADKVSVTVADCNAGNRLLTLHYAPDAVSDAEVLGYHFRHLAVAARAMEQQNQFMTSISGHATLTFDDTTRAIQKTAYWGYNWACGRNAEGATPAASGMPGGAGVPASGAASKAPPTMPVNPINAINPLKRFGF